MEPMLRPLTDEKQGSGRAQHYHALKRGIRPCRSRLRRQAPDWARLPCEVCYHVEVVARAGACPDPGEWVRNPSPCAEDSREWAALAGSI